MKQTTFKAISGLSVAAILSLTSCTSRNTPVDPSKMEREPIDYELITDSLYTSGVSGFVYTGRYVVWADIVQPFNAFEGNFIHVVDPELKKEVASMGRKGNGPNEFNTPDVERYNGDTIYVRDWNIPRQALFSLTDAAEGKNSIIPLASQEIAFEDKLLITKESQVRCNPSYKDTPLRYINGTDTIPFGQYAVNPDVDDDMVRENLLQMAIEYYANLEILICEAAYYPYVALYKKAGNSFELMTEVKGEIDYTISDGWIRFSRDGFFTCKLTKNYLVTLDFDSDKGEKSYHGRDLSKLPRTLFVRDHKGNLLRIFKLDEPTLRLTGCGKDNILYAITAPQGRDESASEFEIVRIDLDKVMGK